VAAAGIGRHRLLEISLKPSLLVLVPVSAARRERIAERFDLLYAPDEVSRSEAILRHGARFRFVLTNGTLGLRADEIDRLPALEFICAMGAGFENVAVAHARDRGLVVVHGAGTNDSCVADHAMAMLLSVLRGLPRLDRDCREGRWRDDLPLPRGITGQRVGILGLGRIGAKIARRAEAFEMSVGYCGRSARPEVAWPRFEDPVALAAWCDALVVATPGGNATRHLVDARVLAALGREGFLVNIARGSVVDTAALARALRDGALAGAALDVFESEPEPPAALLGFDNVLLSPHVAGWSHQSIDASVTLFLANAERYLTGQPVLTPVPSRA
jgi:lactate dehydrogenase-like 2-hydroxyacid dehydrogenase